MSEHEKKPTLREWVEQRHRDLDAAYPLMCDRLAQDLWAEESVLEALDHALELHDAEVAAIEKRLYRIIARKGYGFETERARFKETVSALTMERDKALAIAGLLRREIVQHVLAMMSESTRRRESLTRARAAFCACNQERRRLRDREIARALRMADIIREAHARGEEG